MKEFRATYTFDKEEIFTDIIYAMNMIDATEKFKYYILESSEGGFSDLLAYSLVNIENIS